MTTETDRRLVALALAVVVLVVLLPPLVMGLGMWGSGMWGGGMMGGMWGPMMGDSTAPSWMLWLGVLTQVVFLLVLVGLGYVVYRTLAGPDEGDDAAIEELRAAYARGDLTDEEFESRRERLKRE